MTRRNWREVRAATNLDEAEVANHRQRIMAERMRACEANAKKGTGSGMCDRPLDQHGYCDRASDHLDTDSQ